LYREREHSSAANFAMSSQPLMQTGEPEAEQVDRKTKMKKVCRSCAIITAGILGVLFILSWIVQGIIYWYATLGCSPKHFHNYEFPGGGTSNLGGPAYNLLPRISLSTENPPGWFGKSFAVLPSNEASQQQVLLSARGGEFQGLGSILTLMKMWQIHR